MATTRTEAIHFPGASGGRLAARLEMPAGEDPRAWALFAHCFTCSKDLNAVVRISRALAERGIAMMRFDFTGLGESEGDFADTDFTSNLADLAAAAEWLRRERKAPSLLVGHSLGGAAILAVAGSIPEVRALVTIGAPSDTAHLAHTLEREAPEIDARGEAEVTLAGRAFRIRKELLTDLREQHLRDLVGALRRPLLVLHSPTDNLVGIEHARKIYEAAKHPKSFVSLDGADHLLTREADARWAADVLASWAGRYLESTPAPEKPAGEPTTPGTIVVTGSSTGFPQEVVAGRHRLRADEPASFGGEDSGPSPYDLLVAGLGACTSMTIGMYARRKGWSVPSIRVTLRHEKIHALDCADCETREGKIDRIDREITLEGDLTAEQRARLLEIAERCPVHRTLHSEVAIRSSLAD